MSRSYKDYHTDYYFGFRFPRGHKKAVINNVRKKAIPPVSWDDIPISRDAQAPWRVGKQLVKQGTEYQESIRKLKTKFKLSHHVARNIIDWHLEHHHLLTTKEKG